MGARALEAGERPIPGSLIVAPVALAAVALLLLNDHVLKRAHPGWLTGKLSDLAGLVFFPLLLIAVFEVGADWLRRFSRPSRRVAIAAVVATALAFAWVKATPTGAESYRVALGALQWPLFALLDLCRGLPISGLHRVRFTADPTDLAALPALALPLFFALRRAR